jgi:thiamine pyrophosphate-dependent acetolactate synthase large subunit-like protein
MALNTTSWRSYGVSPELSLMDWPDTAGMARGYGMEAMTVSSNAELTELVKRADQLHGPLLLYVRVDQKLSANYDGSPR